MQKQDVMTKQSVESNILMNFESQASFSTQNVYIKIHSKSTTTLIAPVAKIHMRKKKRRIPATLIHTLIETEYELTNLKKRMIRY